LISKFGELQPNSLRGLSGNFDAANREAQDQYQGKLHPQAGREFCRNGRIHRRRRQGRRDRKFATNTTFGNWGCAISVLNRNDGGPAVLDQMQD
jgi:hypothetical protein